MQTQLIAGDDPITNYGKIKAGPRLHCDQELATRDAAVATVNTQ